MTAVLDSLNNEISTYVGPNRSDNVPMGILSLEYFNSLSDELQQLPTCIVRLVQYLSTFRAPSRVLEAILGTYRLKKQSVKEIIIVVAHLHQTRDNTPLPLENLLAACPKCGAIHIVRSA